MTVLRESDGINGTGFVHDEVVEDGPSIAGRLACLFSRTTIRPALALGSYLPRAPWPWGLVDFAAQALKPAPGTVRATIRLPHCTAQLIRGAGVLRPDKSRRIVLYIHGGAFLTGGTNTHGRLVSMLSKYADSPVLLVNYRTMPNHSIGEAADDCYDAYRWLRDRGWEPDHIVFASDSAGGYLSLTLAERLLDDCEAPAAMVYMSPLMQLAQGDKLAHPNVRTDAMFSAKALAAFAELIAGATERSPVNAHSEQIYEPLDHIEPGLPRTLIHVSGSEVLLHDAQLAARELAAAGVPVEIRIWPGQMHVFQLAAPIAPEATRSLRHIGQYIRDTTDRAVAPRIPSPRYPVSPATVTARRANLGKPRPAHSVSVAVARAEPAGDHRVRSRRGVEERRRIRGIGGPVSRTYP